MRVLVVEEDDERLLADAITNGLRNHAMAADGDAALERLAVNDYDVVVLDRDLPRVSGDQVCTTLVESGADTRILMLTAVAARVAGLGLGADDYLTKPFDFAELIARIHALSRRARPAAPPVLERAGIRFDPHRRTVTRDGEHVALSCKEFAVLAELLRADGGNHPGQVHEAIEAQFKQNRDDTLNTMLTWSLAATGAVGVIAAGLGWLLAGRALRPTAEITATARRVADRSLHERITLSGPANEIQAPGRHLRRQSGHDHDGAAVGPTASGHSVRAPLTYGMSAMSDQPFDHWMSSTRRDGSR